MTIPSDSPDLARYRHALEVINDKYRRSSAAYRPGVKYPTEYAEAWHQGFHTALAECSSVAHEALDPEGKAAWDELWAFGHEANDRAWFKRTGNCGHCGSAAGDCVCTPDDPCGCGPHEPRTWPVDCWVCEGSGKQDPIKRVAR